MTAVFRQQEPITVIDDDWTERIKANARAEPLRRARLNLHHDEADQVQEMLIAFCKDSLTMPHRHLGRTESFHVVEGRLDLVFFDDEGRETRRLRLGAPGSGLPSLYRLNAPDWHLVIPLDEMVVVHETGCGPFTRDAEPPPAWAPRDTEALRVFIDDLRTSGAR